MLNTKIYYKAKKVIECLLALTYAYGIVESIGKQDWYLTVLMGISLLGTIAGLVNLYHGRPECPSPLSKFTSIYYICALVLWGTFFFLTTGYYSIGIILVWVILEIITEIVYRKCRH